MPTEVCFNKELRLIEIKSYGIVTSEDLFSSLRETRALAIETGVTRTLVDTTKEEVLPGIIDLLSFSTAIPRFLRIALVIDESQPTIVFSKSVQAAATVKGATIEMFASREDAHITYGTYITCQSAGKSLA